jgi:hypothetical protein
MYILQWAERVAYDCKITVSVGVEGHEIQFFETIPTSAFPNDRSEIRQRSQSTELPPGVSESGNELEVKAYPEERFTTIHFASILDV